MKIRKFMKQYEQQLLQQMDTLKTLDEAKRLQIRHQRMIAFMQHERFIHLIVTLFFALFTLITLGFALFYPCLSVFILLGLFSFLLIPYIGHYYFLENTIQRWYALSEQIARQIDSFSWHQPQK